MNLEHRLSIERVRRVRDISDILAAHNNSPAALQRATGRAIIVLCYANWEGYFNYCVDELFNYLQVEKLDASKVNPNLLAAMADAEIESFIDRGSSVDHRAKLVSGILSKIGKPIDASTSRPGIKRVCKAGSNLDFKKLLNRCNLIGLEHIEFQKQKNFITHELVRWRHQVAHGEEPDLSSADFDKHCKSTERLLLTTKHCFEDLILDIEAKKNSFKIASA